MSPRNPLPGRRQALVLVVTAVASLAIGSCGGAQRSSASGGAARSDVTENTIRTDLSDPIVVSPDRCPADPSSDRLEAWAELQVIEVDGGRPIHLRGCESEGELFVRFRYAGETPVPSLHVVEYDLYEAGGWIVLSSPSGREWHPSGEPRFSPDRRWFATTAADLTAGYHRNHLDVWAVEADSIRPALVLEGGERWGGTRLRWVSSDTIEFTRITWRDVPTPDRWLDSTAVRVIRRGREWLPSFAREDPQGR